MTATKPTAEELAAILGCKPKYIGARLGALGLLEECSRCGGGGHYSYCQMHGTTCFGCNGRGKQVPRLTKKLIATATAKVAAGELEPYLAEMKRLGDAKRITKGASDRFFAAWKANPTVAADAGLHFMKCSERHHEINSFCAPMCDDLHKATGEIENGMFVKGEKGGRGHYRPLTTEEIEARAARIAEIIRLAGEAEAIAPMTGEKAS